MESATLLMEFKSDFQKAAPHPVLQTMDLDSLRYPGGGE